MVHPFWSTPEMIYPPLGKWSHRALNQMHLKAYKNQDLDVFFASVTSTLLFILGLNNCKVCCLKRLFLVGGSVASTFRILKDTLFAFDSHQYYTIVCQTTPNKPSENNTKLMTTHPTHPYTNMQTYTSQTLQCADQGCGRSLRRLDTLWDGTASLPLWESDGGGCVSALALSCLLHQGLLAWLAMCEIIIIKY